MLLLYLKFVMLSSEIDVSLRGIADGFISSNTHIQVLI